MEKKEILIWLMIWLAISMALSMVYCRGRVIVVVNSTLEEGIDYVCSNEPTPIGCDCKSYRGKECMDWRIELPPDSNETNSASILEIMKWGR